MMSTYQTPDRKTPGGQSPSPEPDGKVLLATGVHPGWQAGERPSLEDPRQPAPTAEEVGRGPLSEDAGRFKAIRLRDRSVVLEYTAGGSNVREWIASQPLRAQSAVKGAASIVRYFEIDPSPTPLWLMMGSTARGTAVALCPGPGGSELVVDTTSTSKDAVLAVRVPAHKTPFQFCVAVSDVGGIPPPSFRALPSALPAPRWPQEVTTAITKSTVQDGFVVDDVALPTSNPWRRNVRTADVQFMKEGTSVTVTLDGDVWLARGLHEPEGPVRWRRFTSGLHEPLTLAIRDDQIFVFDRNGIWRLRDTNGDGEADVHEMFSNAFAQTADMREFPSEIRLAPGGELIIAKGGQEATTIGKHNGSVLRVSADGRTATVMGYGFRQPTSGSTFARA